MVRMMMCAALVVSSLSVAGCNTVRGAGQDMQSAANCTEELMKQGRC